jgi:hypothetical protein
MAPNVQLQTPNGILKQPENSVSPKRLVLSIEFREPGLANSVFSRRIGTKVACTTDNLGSLDFSP